jgi:hypothetical protein
MPHSLALIRMLIRMTNKRRANMHSPGAFRLSIRPSWPIDHGTSADATSIVVATTKRLNDRRFSDARKGRNAHVVGYFRRLASPFKRVD